MVWRVVIARLFNTVGPRQSGRYGMVLPRLVQQALDRQPLTVYGNGQQTRCFCHVYDVVPALIELLEEPRAYGAAINLGGAKETSIEELAELTLHLTGATSTIRHIPYEEAYGPGFEDMQRRVPDLDLARQLIGFAPKHELNDMVRSVIADITTRRFISDAGWLQQEPTDGQPTAGSTLAPFRSDGHDGSKASEKLKRASLFALPRSEHSAGAPS